MADRSTPEAARLPSISLEQVPTPVSSQSLAPSATIASPSASKGAMVAQPHEHMLPPMASSLVADKQDKARKLDISSLMSPPEAVPYDNFNQHSPTLPVAGRATGTSVAATKPPMPMSPPISPFTKATQGGDLPSTPAGAMEVDDPILYDIESGDSPSPLPLFAPAERLIEMAERRRLVDEHVANRSPELFRGSSPPLNDEYHLVLYFKSTMMQSFNKDPRAWLKKERALLQSDARRRHQDRLLHGRYAPILPANKQPVQVIKAPRNTHRVEKSSTRAAPAPRPARAPVAPTARQAKAILAHGGAVNPNMAPEPRRTVAPNREDKDFNSLPNFCPPLSTLPRDKPNILKVEWRGAPINLSQDANAHLLLPEELALAGSLRLDCATYLTSKRRIFIRRLECAHIGKEFRKTDAQMACKIDVNKASKLWTAFDKAGWLDIKHMRPHMQQPFPAELKALRD